MGSISLGVQRAGRGLRLRQRDRRGASCPEQSHRAHGQRGDPARRGAGSHSLRPGVLGMGMAEEGLAQHGPVPTRWGIPAVSGGGRAAFLQHLGWLSAQVLIRGCHGAGGIRPHPGASRRAQRGRGAGGPREEVVPRAGSPPGVAKARTGQNPLLQPRGHRGWLEGRVLLSEGTACAPSAAGSRAHRHRAACSVPPRGEHALWPLSAPRPSRAEASVPPSGRAGAKRNPNIPWLGQR